MNVIRYDDERIKGNVWAVMGNVMPGVVHNITQGIVLYLSVDDLAEDACPTLDNNRHEVRSC